MRSLCEQAEIATLLIPLTFFPSRETMLEMSRCVLDGPEDWPRAVEEVPLNEAESCDKLPFVVELSGGSCCSCCCDPMLYPWTGTPEKEACGVCECEKLKLCEWLLLELAPLYGCSPWGYDMLAPGPFAPHALAGEALEKGRRGGVSCAYRCVDEKQ